MRMIWVQKMNSLVIDYYALGLHPRCYDLLIELIDLELGLSDSPESLYILGYVLDGWSSREIASELGIDKNKIIRHLKKARKFVSLQNI